MKNSGHLREQQSQLMRARESARAIDLLTATQLARELSTDEDRIAPQRIPPALLNHICIKKG